MESEGVENETEISLSLQSYKFLQTDILFTVPKSALLVLLRSDICGSDPYVP